MHSDHMIRNRDRAIAEKMDGYEAVDEVANKHIATGKREERSFSGG